MYNLDKYRYIVDNWRRYR